VFRPEESLLGAVGPLKAAEGGGKNIGLLPLHGVLMRYPQDKTVQLFRAFAPMLCKRPTRKIEDTVKEMQGSKFTIEEKLDGERMQLHKRGNEYFYCSRSGELFTVT
jgi:ATP-dependent DNA ligase